MNRTILLALFLLPLTCFSQSKKDYRHALATFMKYYNEGQADSICNMYSDSWGAQKKTLFTKQDIESLQARYGTMVSYKYMAMEPDDSVMLFKGEFTKSTHMIGISLDGEKKMETFRFHTSSPFIDSLLKK